MPTSQIKAAKYVIALTIIVGLFYLGLFLYNGGYLFPQPSCPEAGGICKESCSASEQKIGACGSIACCKPLAGELNSALVRKAVLDRDIRKCVGTGAEAACKLAVMDMLNADFAKRYIDLSYCDKISNTEIRDSCLSDIAQIKADPEICRDISATGIKDKCLIGLVKGKEDWEICGREISSEYNRDTCFQKLALLIRNSEPCNQLSLPQAVYGCYMLVELSQSIPNVYCDGLAKDKCETTKGCKPLIVSDIKEEVTNAYLGCKRDEKYFCEITGGKWVVSNKDDIVRLPEEKCVCSEGKAYIEEYGCFRCSSLKTQYAIEECSKRMPAKEPSQGSR